MTLDSTLLYVCRAALALLFVRTALHKLYFRTEFATAVLAYRLVPAPLTSVLVTMLTATEAVVALSLVFTSSALAGVAAATLLSLYTGAIVVNLARGNEGIDCGCGGPAGGLPLSRYLVGRNLVVIFIAALASSTSTGRPLLWIDAATIAAATASLAVLYIAAETAAAAAKPWRGMAQLS